MFQTQKMSMNKSKNNYWLTMHVFFYTLITASAWMVYFALDFIYIPFLAVFLIFALHWITDYITSRITSKLYAKGDYHNFFVVIGFDCFLHYCQLFLIYKYLIVK